MLLAIAGSSLGLGLPGIPSPSVTVVAVLGFKLTLLTMAPKMDPNEAQWGIYLSHRQPVIESASIT